MTRLAMRKDRGVRVLVITQLRDGPREQIVPTHLRFGSALSFRLSKMADRCAPRHITTRFRYVSVGKMTDYDGQAGLRRPEDFSMAEGDNEQHVIDGVHHSGRLPCTTFRC